MTILLAFALYFGALIGIGLYFYKRDQTASEFMLGDRSINYWVSAIATQSSDMGSWLFLGFPAVVYTSGMFQCWTAIGLVVGMTCAWFFIAPRLRERTAQKKALTLSTYFADRFHDRSGMIQIISSLFALLFFFFYIAAGLIGLSVVFSTAFSIPYKIGILLSLITALAYTLIGGFVAVAWCDFVQGIFLLGVIITVPMVGLFKLGGIAPIIAQAKASSISLSLLKSPSEMLSAIFLALSWGLGYAGQPHILVNFMGIDDPKNISRARWVGISWQIAVLAASVAIGLVGIGMFPFHSFDSEQLFIEMGFALFHPFVAGLMFCAVFAATLSTMDSLILVSGSTIAEDIFKPLTKKTYTARRLLLISRLGSIVIAFGAVALAWYETASIYDLVNYAWSGLGSTFGPLVIVSLTNMRINWRTAFLGLISGATTAMVWPFLFASLPLLPGFCAGFLGLAIGKVIFRRD